ncbi:uncharacterized protein LOC116209175 [Punica granatum]|uniref:RAB6A-GEF complex partner protein 2 n=2 Tax=Punica granatum TaxID=22663 RepID=A0A218WX84_PUNGR|nr:uncharacterized protein LOC116209175 [Punica granatum]OWM77465.1 hypothetical protein CDL15_Pgr016862 [Punica granatum]PKI69453.1 hypothetical protein CRG98_010156 [Punica granatum]
MLPPRFSIFGGGDTKQGLKSRLPAPFLNLRTDREVYRPGDQVTATVEISCPSILDPAVLQSAGACSLLIKRLGFEIKGIEKLDCQWFATQKPSPDSKQRRGEYVFMDGAAPHVISNLIVSPGSVKTYVVRTVLPSILPPSYKGATIRYLYYVRTVLSGQWQILDKSYSQRDSSKDLTEVEARVPLQVWVNQKNSGLLLEDGQGDGIVPSTTIQLDMYWKEMDGESDWVRASDVYDVVEEGYDSSKDEIASVSSYNPAKESMYRSFGSSLSLQSSPARSSSRDLLHLEGQRSSLSNLALPRLSITEVFDNSNADESSQKSPIVSPSQQQRLVKSSSLESDEGVSSVAAENFIRGRSYNIRLDDQVLLRFSPKNSDSTYYFSDMIGGTLTFFHEERARRCLEVLITLETSETINRRFVHPSRRNSPTITKVQSDHHEVVADLVQTSFQFSIPMDGPMSFSTSRISVQWSLRFEFYTTPKNVDWTRYEHPLLVEGRDKCEWVLPITVHAPPSRSPAAQSRSEKQFSLEPLWVRT